MKAAYAGLDSYRPARRQRRGGVWREDLTAQVVVCPRRAPLSLYVQR
jgi:hypothetical protein